MTRIAVSKMSYDGGHPAREWDTMIDRSTELMGPTYVETLSKRAGALQGHFPTTASDL